MRRHNALSVILIILVMIYLLIPLLACVIYSLFSKWTGVVPKGFTLSAYQELFSNTAFWSALGQTMLLCIAPIAITISRRSRSPLRLFCWQCTRSSSTLRALRNTSRSSA